MTFIEEIFNNKQLSESSKKLYTNNLRKLNNGNQIENIDFLKDIEKINEIISKYKPATQRSFIISIISVVKSEPELYKKYFDLLTKLNSGVKVDNFKNIYDINLV